MSGNRFIRNKYVLVVVRSFNNTSAYNEPLTYKIPDRNPKAYARDYSVAFYFIDETELLNIEVLPKLW